MEVDVMDDPDKSVGQQANGCYRNHLLKGGQQKYQCQLVAMDVHVIVGTRHMPVLYRAGRGQAGVIRFFPDIATS
jgi:hypothetical protein